MLHSNSDYILNELEEIKRSRNTNYNISNIIREDILKNCLEITSIETFFGKFSCDIDNYFNTFPLHCKNQELEQFFNGINIQNLSAYFNVRKVILNKWF